PPGLILGQESELVVDELLGPGLLSALGGVFDNEVIGLDDEVVVGVPVVSDGDVGFEREDRFDAFVGGGKDEFAQSCQRSVVGVGDGVLTVGVGGFDELGGCAHAVEQGSVRVDVEMNERLVQWMLPRVCVQVSPLRVTVTSGCLGRKSALARIL